MTDKNKTEIIIVLDRSGSMASMKSDVQGGFAKFIEEQRSLPGECLVTLAQFDNEYDVVYEAKPIDDVPHLELHPRGGTALLDAIGRTIDAVGVRLMRTHEADRPGRVVIVVITDGHENQSRTYSREQIQRMITIQREKFSWEFFFLGAKEDAIAVAQSYGIPKGRAATYRDARAMYSAVSANVGSLRSGGQVRDQQELTREHESK